MTDLHEVAVIIPTLAQQKRRLLLRRAIDSVVEQAGVRAVPIVVVNGGEADPETVTDLSRNRRVVMIRNEEAGLPLALRTGLACVASPWFGTLDDDDFLLPGALQARCAAVVQHGDCNAIVTNGYRMSSATAIVHINDMSAVARDPYRSLEGFNWLLPGAWTCRSDACALNLFDGMPRYRECTFLAIQLVRTRKLLFLDMPTVVWQVDTPDSESKSRGYRLGQAEAIRQLLRLELPVSLRVYLRHSLRSARHLAASTALGEGDGREAWRQHIKSLNSWRAWRYLPFTLRLLLRK